MKYKIRMYLVRAREKLGYSQYRAAIAAGMSHQHYNRIENGKITNQIQFKTVVMISQALEIPVTEIWNHETFYQASQVKNYEEL